MEAVRRLLISLIKGLNFVVRKISAFTHFVQFGLQWGFHPRPEWFDHYIDQHWQFSAKNNGLWVERGVFSRMVLKSNSRMLEICCGDGFNARHFYSSKASSIIAIDFDRDAIPHAKRFNSAPNISYLQKDIRGGLPAGHSTTSYGMRRLSILLKRRSKSCCAKSSACSGRTES